jgi:deaminated glutathione amidase
MVLAAVGQFCATNSLVANGEVVASLISQAAKLGAKVLFLPEASDYIAGSPEETIQLAKPVEASEFVSSVKKALGSVDNPPDVSVGIHEPTDDGKRVKNTLLYFSSKGILQHRYQKIHLFDVDIE